MRCDWLATGAMVPHTNDLVALLFSIVISRGPANCEVHRNRSIPGQF